MNFSGTPFDSEIIAIKLCDFGVSKSISESTMANTFLGTFRWMSPEIISKQRKGYTKQTDIWRFTILLFLSLLSF